MARTGAPARICRTTLGVVVALTLAAASGPPQAQDAPEVEALIRGVQHREASIATVRGRLTEWIHRDAEKRTRTLHQVSFVLEDGRARYSAAAFEGGSNHWDIAPGVSPLKAQHPGSDAASRTEHPRRDVTLDGAYETVYENFTGVAHVRPQEQAPKLASMAPFAELLLLSIQSHSYGDLLLSVPADADGRRQVSIAAGQWAGQACEVVDFPLPRLGARAWRYRLWVRADMGYAIVRVHGTAHSEETGDLARENIYEGMDFTELAEGIWLPKQTLRQYYRYDLNPDEPVEDRWVIFSGLAVNEPVSDADFVARIPPGAHISLGDGAPVPPGWGDAQRAAKKLGRVRQPDWDLRLGGE